MSLITEEVKIECKVKSSFKFKNNFNYYGFTARVVLVSLGHPHNEVKMLIILQSYHFQEVPL